MIKVDIVNEVSRLADITKVKAEVAVDAVFDAMRTSMQRGERIELRGFGVFQVKPRKRGIGRNPRTGKEVRIPPGRTIRFKPGKDLQDIGGLTRQPPPIRSGGGRREPNGQTSLESASRSRPRTAAGVASGPARDALPSPASTRASHEGVPPARPPVAEPRAPAGHGPVHHGGRRLPASGLRRQSGSRGGDALRVVARALVQPDGAGHSGHPPSWATTTPAGTTGSMRRSRTSCRRRS